MTDPPSGQPADPRAPRGNHPRVTLTARARLNDAVDEKPSPEPPAECRLGGLTREQLVRMTTLRLGWPVFMAVGSAVLCGFQPLMILLVVLAIPAAAINTPVAIVALGRLRLQFEGQRRGLLATLVWLGPLAWLLVLLNLAIVGAGVLGGLAILSCSGRGGP